ncbi:MAG: hypothetical protein ABIL58_07760 [Pseudomonadota bacterium]
METTGIPVRTWRWALMTAVLVSVAASGCMGTYGKVKRDADLPGRFLAGEVPADYKYYFNGRDTMPYAIVGIKPEYELVSRFWTPVPPNTEAFKKMARNAWTTPPYEPPVAGTMLSPEDVEIGLWYSYYPWAVIKMEGGNAVSISSPYKPDSSMAGD